MEEQRRKEREEEEEPLQQGEMVVFAKFVMDEVVVVVVVAAAAAVVVADSQEPKMEILKGLLTRVQLADDDEDERPVVPAPPTGCPRLTRPTGCHRLPHLRLRLILPRLEDERRSEGESKAGREGRGGWGDCAAVNRRRERDYLDCLIRRCYY